MGSYLQESMSLMEMDATLDRMLEKSSKSARIITDLPLTMEDIQELLNKLAVIQHDMELVERYRISIVTAWAYALRYENLKKDDYRSIVEKLDQIPQYSIRRFFEICGAVFADYGLVMYYSEIQRKEELYTMITVHAGIPEYAAERFYPLLDQLRDKSDLSEGMNKMDQYLEGKLVHIAGVSSREILQNLLQTAVNLMGDCREGKYTEKELRRRYPLTSTRLIKGCLNWAKNKAGDCS